VILKHQKKIARLEEKLEAATGPKDCEGQDQGAAQAALADRREHVYVNRVVRELKYTNGEKKRLLDKVNKTVDAMRTLERQIKSLDEVRGVEVAKS
jgi:RNA polymerase primary sigma factor